MNTKTTASQPHSRDANNISDAHHSGNTRNIMDVNNSRAPATTGPQQQHLLPDNINAKNRRDASLSRDANNIIYTHNSGRTRNIMGVNNSRASGTTGPQQQHFSRRL